MKNSDTPRTDKACDYTAPCSGKMNVWAEDGAGLARKVVYDQGYFVLLTREARFSQDEEWERTSEAMIHKEELAAAAVFLPNGKGETSEASATAILR